VRIPGRKKDKGHYCFPVLIEKQANGYLAVCPSLLSCYTTGPGYEEVLAKIKAKIQDHLQGLLDQGKPVPEGTTFCFTLVEIEG
jgi:predicted RNase H-like HicB family nuclease